MPNRLNQSVLVYDIGGSHVSAAICHKRQDGYELGPVLTAPHPVEPKSSAFLDLLHLLGAKAGSLDHAGAQLAVPDPFDFKAGVSLMRHKLPYLFGVDLRGALADRFQWRGDQLQFVHDSAAFLLGELHAGCARESSCAVGITLGTGIGSAFSRDRVLITQGYGVPDGGQIWNLPFDGGTVEDLLSSRGIETSFRRRTGLQCSVVEIAALAAENEDAVKTFVEFGTCLGRILKEALEPFSPQVVALGGGISKAAQLFLPWAQSELRETAIELCVSARPEEAPLIGAAVAWFNDSSRSAGDGHER